MSFKAMTVKELKKRLAKVHDDAVVLVPMGMEFRPASIEVAGAVLNEDPNVRCVSYRGTDEKPVWPYEKYVQALIIR